MHSTIRDSTRCFSLTRVQHARAVKFFLDTSTSTSTKVCFRHWAKAMFLKPVKRKHLSTRSGGGTLITRQPGHIISDLYEVIQKRSLLTQLQFARKHVVVDDDVTAAAGYVNRRCIRCHRRRRPLEEIQPGRDPFKRRSPVARVLPESEESGGG